MQSNAQRFYETAAEGTTDAATRKLLGDLAVAEVGHAEWAGKLIEEKVNSDVNTEEKYADHRQFVLT